MQGMYIGKPPEKKALIVYKSKTQMLNKKKRREKNKQLEKEKKTNAIANLEKKIEMKKIKKERVLEIFESYTNTIQQVEEEDPRKKTIPKAKKLALIKEYDELREGLDSAKIDFLSKEEIIDLRKSHKDFQIGDYAMVFANPDLMAAKGITLKEALHYYDTCLNVVTDSSLMVKDEFLKQREAFVRAFLSLERFLTKEEIEKKNRLLLEKRKSKKLIKNSSSSKLVSENNGENKKLEDDEEEEDEENIDLDETNKKRIEEALKIDITDLRKIYNEERKYCAGGYLIKRMVPDSDDFDWICNNEPPKDFLTLFRNVIMTKLTRVVFFHCRTFLTSDEKFIVMVVKANEETVKHEATESHFDKQLELGFCDLFSLEPVDDSGRPLRIKTYITNPEFQEEDFKPTPDIEEQDRKNGVTISARVSSLFQTVQKMSDIQLQSLLCNKQRRINDLYNKIAYKINQNITFDGEIIDDVKVSRETWEAYYIFLAYIDELIRKIECDCLKNKEIRENVFFLYRLAFKKAFGEANAISYSYNKNWCLGCLGLESKRVKNPLITVWDIMTIDPTPPYMPYFFGAREKDLAMWRSYEINEKNMRSHFSNMEKLKLTNKIVLKHINILGILKNKLADSWFPLHDDFQMNGEFNGLLYKRIFKSGFLMENVATAEMKKFQNYCIMLSTYADSEDFDSDGLCLADELAFNLKIPWRTNVKSIRNYFGEKIAIYFNFLSCYTYLLFPMAILGIIFQIIIDHTSTNVGSGFKIVFSTIIVIWSTAFIEAWKRKQALFASEYGQLNIANTAAERPTFKGTFIRSICDEDYNFKYYSNTKRTLKVLFSYIISVLILVAVIATVIGIFLFKQYLSECNCVDDENPFVKAIPSIINSIQIAFFNFVYHTVALKLNEFENHRIIQTYENSLVFKIFAFTFVNTFNSFIFLSFFNDLFPWLGLCKVKIKKPFSNSTYSKNLTDPANLTNLTRLLVGSNNTLNDTAKIPIITYVEEIVDGDCFLALSIQMKTLFIVAFVKNFPELITPFIKLYLANRYKKKDENPVQHPFLDIDNSIENQIMKSSYAVNLEVDGTVEDYMELMIQFGYLSLFAISFPISYLLAFITNCLEIQVDKLKLLRFKRRPIPESAADIGTWFFILDFISFAGIFTNSGLIAYAGKVSDDISSADQIKIFVLFSLAFLAIKYFVKAAIPDIPHRVLLMGKRHSNILEAVRSGFGSNKAKEMKASKVSLEIMNVGMMDEKND